MSTTILLTHNTSYRYDRKISLGPHIIRLRPAPHSKTEVVSYNLHVTPTEHFINWQQDPYGNYQARLVFHEKTERFQVKIGLKANMKVINPFDFFVESGKEQFPFTYSEEERKELKPYLEISENGVLLRKFLMDLSRKKQDTNDFLVMVNQAICKNIGYVIRMEPGVQTCEETLKIGSGSCRDSAYLLVQAFRHMGLAARFVSGYLVQLKADVPSKTGPSGPPQDFTDLHAWTEVYIPGAGWIGLDPTSGLLTGEGHIPLAATPEPSSAAPIQGALEKAEVEFDFSMEVVRVYETPRVTLPYSDTQWQEIINLGNAIQEKTSASGMKLTMGGEPTFVSEKNRDKPEWNFEALGEEKYTLSEQLLENLSKHFANGPVFQFCQGKWYPGEPVPRWAMICYWRKDGQKIIQEEKVLQKRANVSYDTKDAKQFILEFCKLVGISPRNLIPGHEDHLYYLWRERNLPETYSLKLDDPYDAMERKRLVELLEKGVTGVTGYALPLRYNFDLQGWESSLWSFRTGKMFLLPGDSPMGLRLPIRSISDRFGQELYPIDPMVYSKTPLPERKPGDWQYEAQPVYYRNTNVSQTAMCVEPGEGALKVFLPPVSNMEQWLELIYLLEKVSLNLDIPIHLQGYEAPIDPRIERFKITPDPGVIEVNLHPSKTWQEMLEKTQVLYKEAEDLHLSAEKFLLDGRHSGTGGGNHITLGAEFPRESPFLQRAHLLPSLVTFWQHHPSLSYLFSGLFIGPTSQSPRIDEANEEMIYELQTSIQQIFALKSPAPWMMDRLFRNILADLTGNTHRSEICIDKLFSPSSSSGRLGLVELRAFEMPPHYRMSLVQQLLIMSIVACFWDKPYKHDLVHWGTSLHDKFMLPQYVWTDFKDVIDHLQRNGFAIKEEWFLPFFEFRFPIYGTRQEGDISIEVRMALEPWNVLGEEMTSLGVSRSVDSAIERLQVKVFGLTYERYIVACNGFALPLQATGVQGEYVAGVRFKAWNPPYTMHPSVPVHNPLVFSIYDKWNSSYVGGCTYHVSHPGGRAYDILPVNALEAESRRISRFWNHGFEMKHNKQPISLENAKFPYTLDLRKTLE
ncbi:MAG: transglutaminase family protein [Spirochaetota bacterium]